MFGLSTRGSLLLSHRSAVALQRSLRGECYFRGLSRVMHAFRDTHLVCLDFLFVRDRDRVLQTRGSFAYAGSQSKQIGCNIHEVYVLREEKR